MTANFQAPNLNKKKRNGFLSIYNKPVLTMNILSWEYFRVKDILTYIPLIFSEILTKMKSKNLMRAKCYYKFKSGFLGKKSDHFGVTLPELVSLSFCLFVYLIPPSLPFLIILGGLQTIQ